MRDFQKILEQLVDRKNHKDGLEDKLKDLSGIHAVIQALIAISNVYIDTCMFIRVYTYKSGHFIYVPGNCIIMLSTCSMYICKNNLKVICMFLIT